jgi:hypothetical protein
MTEHPLHKPDQPQQGIDRQDVGPFKGDLTERDFELLKKLLNSPVQSEDQDEASKNDRGVTSETPPRLSPGIATELTAPKLHSTERITQEDGRPEADIRALKEYPPPLMSQLRQEFDNVVGKHLEQQGGKTEEQLLKDTLADRPDILHLIKLDIAHYGPELYDMMMEQY